jgi:hypothetical protein
MGLEIFYDLHAPASWDRLRVRRTVRAARQHALTVGFQEVNRVQINDPSHPRTMGVRHLPKDLPYLAAEAEDGWFFRTWPGEGCETALFGLCKFPAQVSAEGHTVAFGWGGGWHFHSWCKTQYADVVSRAHFLKCHLGIISILDFFRAEGCRVQVRDGGDFWKSRRVETLTRHLERMHAIVAAVAGAVKDAGESSAGRFVAPIARHPQFERLEATGHVLLAQKRRRKHSKQK